MIYVILGGSASGKGTRSRILCKELNIPHISTGELLRKVAEKDEEIREKLTNGYLISDEFTTDLLYERLSKEDCSNGFVIDGYPRTLNQVYLLDEILEKLNTSLTGVIELTVPDEVVFERILGRSECSICGKSYGNEVKPRIVNICDVCSGTLVTRSDDNEETLKKKIDIYKEKSKPIIEYYKERELHMTIDASNNPEKILSVINCNV